MSVGEDEFVELDAEGQPSAARWRQARARRPSRRQCRSRKAPVPVRRRPTAAPARRGAGRRSCGEAGAAEPVVPSQSSMSWSIASMWAR